MERLSAVLKSKTYWGLIGLGIVGLLYKGEVIDLELAQVLGGLFAALAGVGYRSAIAKGPTPKG